MAEDLNDLDRRVAIKLGWKQLGPLKHDPLNVALEKDGKVIEGLPFYSTDIKAAWEIVSRFCDCSGFRFTLVSTADNQWAAKWITFSMGEEIIMGDGEIYAKAPTAPRAICLSFLKLP